MLKKRHCNSVEHGPHVEGCRCYFEEKDRRNGKTNFRYRSGNSKRTVCQHDVCYHNNDQHGHRMWNRDVSAAINIGCRFLAGAMQRDLGPWTRRNKGKNSGTDVQGGRQKRRKNNNNTHSNTGTSTTTNGIDPTTTPLVGWARVFQLGEGGETLVSSVFRVPPCRENKTQKKKKKMKVLSVLLVDDRWGEIL